MKPLFLMLLCATVLVSACTIKKGQYRPQDGIYDVSREGDPLVVNAQRVRGVALEVFDGFMKIERMEEARLKKVNPTIHEAAEEIRRHGKTWLTDLTNAIDLYQRTRTEAQRLNLNQALAIVQTALATAQNYLAQTKK